MPRLPRDPARLAARLTWGGLADRVLDDADRARVAAGLAGLVLFERSLRSPEEVRELVADIRATAPGPVRIAVDQEGGHVSRLAAPLTAFPGPMALAAAGSAELAEKVALASARELRALGIDTVLAPVLDVAADPTNPTIAARSFGDDPAIVAGLGAAMVRGYLAGGVLPVPKHFPGHGRTSEDSHLALPVIEGSRLDLVARDLPPFAAAIAAGAPALMTAHIVLEAVDRGRPASLSTAITRLARRDLGFEGLLVTDALVMDAIADRYPLGDAAPHAIRAGMDVVMALEGQRRVLAGLAEAIAAAEIPVARLETALRRAAAFDARLASLPGPAIGVPLDPGLLTAHRSLAARVARRSLTLVEDSGGIVPLHPGVGLFVVDVRSPHGSPIEGVGARLSAAGEAWEAGFPRAEVRAVAAGDIPALAAVVEEARAAEVVLLLTRDLGRSPARDLPAALAATGRPVVHAALRNPLDLTLPGPLARIAAYADTPHTHRALAEALRLGPAAFPGRLPIGLARVGGEVAVA